MDEALYDSERLLQEMLAKHPDLLAGEQINIDDPRRWLLITREMSVPDEEDGSGRWSIDHLFLDQEGIPTLVEVKRSSDTRIRREVVGQRKKTMAHRARLALSLGRDSNSIQAVGFYWGGFRIFPESHYAHRFASCQRCAWR